MKELELSVQLQHPGLEEELSRCLDQFEAKHNVHVRLLVFNWVDAWQELVKIALYRHGPDVSQIGSTWVSGLAGMNAVRPFDAPEIRVMGSVEAFLPTSWNSCMVAGDPQIWAIPFLAYESLFYYRRDWLEHAGIDENTAFTTPQNLAEALRKLSEEGEHVPWLIPTQHLSNTLHYISSWIWHAGSDYISPDGKQILFNKPAAMSGIQAYFDLYRYLPSQTNVPGQEEADYYNGKVAITLETPELWNYELPNTPGTAPEVIANTGVATPFGVPFVGASNLVIWKHTPHTGLALELVKFLTSRTVQSKYAPTTGLLPVRQDVLSEPPFTNQPVYQTMEQGLKTGRSFPSLPLWGLVEDKLSLVLAEVWKDVLSSKNPDIPTILKNRIDPLAQRLEVTLAQ